MFSKHCAEGVGAPTGATYFTVFPNPSSGITDRDGPGESRLFVLDPPRTPGKRQHEVPLPILAVPASRREAVFFTPVRFKPAPPRQC